MAVLLIHILLPFTFTESSTQGVAVLWYQIAGPTLPLLNMTSSLSSTSLIIPSRTLKAGVHHTFIAYAYSPTYTSQASSARVDVDVLASAPVALISGGNIVVSKSSSSISIWTSMSASQRYDPDIQSSASSSSSSDHVLSIRLLTRTLLCVFRCSRQPRTTFCSLFVSSFVLQY